MNAIKDCVAACAPIVSDACSATSAWSNHFDIKRCATGRPCVSRAGTTREVLKSRSFATGRSHRRIDIRRRCYLGGVVAGGLGCGRKSIHQGRAACHVTDDRAANVQVVACGASRNIGIVTNQNVIVTVC
jgi:hypothetical protein